nr:MAG TPA: hypothetical protein [Caudoviricetes sp.]
MTNVRNQQIYTSLLTFLPGRIAIVYQLLLVIPKWWSCTHAFATINARINN